MKIKLQPPVIDDCSTGANVKVDTMNCQCNKFSCLSRRFASKRSRYKLHIICCVLCIYY